MPWSAVQRLYSFHGLDLEGRLILPRLKVTFDIVPGRVETLDGASTDDLHPWARSYGKLDLFSEEGGKVIDELLIPDTTGKGAYPGLGSGARSGLLEVGGRLLKIKGCGVAHAFEKDQDYTRRRTDLSSPFGGQLLSNARRELELTHSLNEMLQQEGFPTAYQPRAAIVYDKLFKTDHTRTRQEMGASIMEVKGDTRVPELIEFPFATNAEMAASIMLRLGVQTGAMKRLTQDKFSWYAPNAHMGNVLVWSDQQHVWAYMADVDVSRIRTSKFDHGGKKYEMQNILASIWQESRHLTGNENYSMTFLLKERQHIRLPNGSILTTGGNELQAHILRLKQEFATGLITGYGNPDERKPIPIADLAAAFAIPHPIQA